jgi:hypothetical protein
MINVFRRLLAGIHYSDHVDADRKPRAEALRKASGAATGADFPDVSLRKRSGTLAERLTWRMGEHFYRCMLHASLWTAGAKVAPEKPENRGRLDLEEVYGPLTYVIGLKISENAGGAARAVREGMKQIRGRGYGRASGTPVLVSIAIGRAERNVAGCLYEKDGRETEVEIGIEGGRREKAKPSGGRTEPKVPGDREVRSGSGDCGNGSRATPPGCLPQHRAA